MGMYASVDGTEVKMSGLMYSVILDILQVEDVPPFVALDKEQVQVLLSEMVKALEKGRKLINKDGMVSSSDLLHLSSDAEVAARLISWTMNEENKYLEFA